MLIELSEIFNNTVKRLNKVATDAQLESAFLSSCSLFFSEVIIFVECRCDIDDAPKAGDTVKIDKTAYPPIVDPCNLGIGEYKVVRRYIRDEEDLCLPLSQTYKQENIKRYVSLGIQPIDYHAFKLPISYQNSFEIVCSYYLDEIEKDNLQYVQQLGIDYAKDIEDKSVEDVRNILLQRHSIEVGGIVCL